MCKILLFKSDEFVSKKKYSFDLSTVAVTSYLDIVGGIDNELDWNVKS